MPTLRRPLQYLGITECDHPWLALQHLAPFATEAETDRANPEQKKKISSEKADLIKRVAEEVPPQLFKCYKDAFKRRFRALDGYTAGIEGAKTRFFSLQVEGRLASGLGNASVLENGLSLNHTYGLPYLPGTGLKGMASAMAHLGLDSDTWNRGTEDRGKWSGQGPDHKVLFGTMDTGAEDAAAGIVIFHDAWWDPSPANVDATHLPFDADVMTPHHQKYNLDGGDWPNDWESPVPVPYITVRGTFQIALTGPAEWVEAAFEILKMAFQHLGFGAKTQIGYGRGDLVPFATEEDRAQLLAEEEAERMAAEQQQRAALELAAQQQRAALEQAAETVDGKLLRTDPGRGLYRLEFGEYKLSGLATPEVSALLGEATWPQVKEAAAKRGDKGVRLLVRHSQGKVLALTPQP